MPTKITWNDNSYEGKSLRRVFTKLLKRFEKDIKDEKKKGIVERMDKNENVKWFLNMKVEHRIIFITD